MSKLIGSLKVYYHKNSEYLVLQFLERSVIIHQTFVKAAFTMKLSKTN